MAAQNIYDNPEFFAGYVMLDRQVRGLDGAAEWPELRAMLPELAEQRVADLGCGFGWFSRWAHEQGATSVVGVDASTKMLERANADTDAPTIEYRCQDLDDVQLAATSVDVVFSSLTLHYVRDLDRLLAMSAQALTDGGALVFSVEHPIYSAPVAKDFETSSNGDRIWPLRNYLVEGERVTSWFVDGVVKQHRTIATYVNSAIGAGFRVDQIEEWGPTAEQVEKNPSLADDLHRPWFLLIRATRVSE